MPCYLQSGDGEIVLPVWVVARRQVDWENKTDEKRLEIQKVTRRGEKAFSIPGDCKNGPEKTINSREGFGEDIADAVDSADLRVLVQGLH